MLKTTNMKEIRIAGGGRIISIDIIKFIAALLISNSHIMIVLMIGEKCLRGISIVKLFIIK